MNPRRFVLNLVAVLAVAPAVAQAQAPAPRAPVPPPPPLIDIRNVTVRDLQVAYFRVDSSQLVRIEAIGGQPQGRSAAKRFLDHGIFQGKEDRMWDKTVWPGNAWILDARTRRVVWELARATDLTDNDNGLVAFRGPLRLHPGTYVVYYAALFPVSRAWEQDRDWRVRTDPPVRVEDLRGPYLDDGTFKEFRIRVWAKGRLATEKMADDERDRDTPFVLKSEPGSRHRAGFEITKAVAVELYGVGEKADGDWQDYGWIREIPSQRVVWSFRNEPSRAGGGAAKNRELRDTTTLPAGRYLAYYSADDSHHSVDWTETPPYDPASWGLSIRVVDPADRAAIKPFDYKPIEGTPIVAFTNLRNDEFRYQRFSVLKPLDVHIFAVGEGSGSVMSDRGWLTDSTGRANWKMVGDNTQPAGGSTKNRMFDGTVHLEPGNYTAYFVTDGSHSAGSGWNAAAPHDPEYWGMTIAPANPAVKPETVVTLMGDAPGPSVLARIDRVGNGAHERARFTLAADGPVRITTIGEGSSGDGREMDDFGWIEDATGRTVWRMAFDDTEPAGGSTKNRREDAIVRLKAGEYTVHFRTDGSHAFGDWNTTRPDDPLGWGITVTRVR